jgi:formylglycine-generating enzyme required for sulfatase activity
MEFALIPHGKTLRGQGNFDEYLGSKEIEIATDFYLGRYEVTQDEWIKVMERTPVTFPART